MGIGSFNNSNGEFNFVVSATHTLSATEKTQWQARFIEASRILQQATEGQLKFGKIFFADEGYGLGLSDFTLNPINGTAYATLGQYGRLGRSIQLFQEQKDGDARTIVHEFGHHAFGLGDEYGGPVSSDDIDTTITFDEWEGNDPIYRRVPLVDASVDSNLLSFAYAIFIFGGVVNRTIVQGYDGVDYLPPSPNQAGGDNILRVAGVVQNPHGAQGSRVYYQPQNNPTDGFQIRCAVSPSNENFSLMDRYGTHPQVTEFCSADNHDPDGDTSHHAIHGVSCWEVIEQTMQDRYNFQINTPNPAVVGPDSNEFPIFSDLVKESRIALIMDRSGSMNDDNKIQAAGFGVGNWIQSASVAGDYLSVSWYNETIDTPLALSEFTNAANLQGIIDQAIDVQAEGWTNIRDALYKGIDEIESRDDRAALQAIVLLTDGIHNRPEDTSLLEALPSLQDAGIAVYVIALGAPENMNYAELETLALETGGTITDVQALAGSDNVNTQFAAIAVTMNIVNANLRNGLVSVNSDNVEGLSPESRLHKLARFGKEKQQPKFKDILKVLELDSVKDLLKLSDSSVVKSKFHVEKGAQRANFSIVFDQKQSFMLCLIDPNGNIVDYDGQTSHLVSSEHSFKAAIIDDPDAGTWTAIMIRTTPGGMTQIHQVASVENRQIVAHANCDRDAALGASIKISAGAKWGDDLSNLLVRATFIGPGGLKHTVDLDDNRINDPNCGEYEGFFQAHKPGRYSGYVTIKNKGNALRAGAMHRILHDLDNGKETSVDLRSDAPKFIRRVPIYFDVDNRKKQVDLDESHARTHPFIRTRETKINALDISKALELMKSK